MNIAAVVILYNPDKGFFNRLNSYISFISKVYLIDNSEVSCIDFRNFLALNQNVEYILNQTNEGIAKPLNQAANRAMVSGFRWLLTMDQDSSFNRSDFKKYINSVSNYINISQVAMFGVEYDKRKLTAMDNCNFIKVNHLITSGSLLNLELYKSTTGFDENLFIDQVDHEYCFRVRLKGFEVIKLNNILLNHTLGLISTHRSLKNLKYTPRTLHSSLRIYYMVRNYLYIKQKYFKEFRAELTQIKKSLLNSIKNNLLYNTKRGSVVKYILLGYIHFKRGRMGKY